MEKRIKQLRITSMIQVGITGLVAAILFMLLSNVLINVQALDATDYSQAELRDAVTGMIIYFGASLFTAIFAFIAGLRLFTICDNFRLARKFPKPADILTQLNKQAWLMYAMIAVCLINLVLGTLMNAGVPIAQLVCWIGSGILFILYYMSKREAKQLS